MRTRFRYDADLDAVVEIRNNYFEERPEGPSLIRDDLGAGVNGIKHLPSGKMLDSKSAHYRENKARGLVHVGNETNFAVKRERVDPNEFGQAVKDAGDQLKSNWNGVASERRTEREERAYAERNR